MNNTPVFIKVEWIMENPINLGFCFQCCESTPEKSILKWRLRTFYVTPRC
jgi:hypothetical protein